MATPYTDAVNTLVSSLSGHTAQQVETALGKSESADVLAVVVKRLLALEDGGGGGGLAYQSVPLNYNTSGLLAGVVAFTIPEDSLLLHAILSVTTAFDGSTPGIWIGTPDQPAAVMSSGVNALDTDLGQNLTGAVVDTVSSGSSSLIARGGDVDVIARLGSGSDVGVDPGSSHGATTLYYLIGAVA